MKIQRVGSLWEIWLEMQKHYTPTGCPHGCQRNGSFNYCGLCVADAVDVLRQRFELKEVD